jgi:[ribosomal protein S5]-alanine N-acetyltransferase
MITRYGFEKLNLIKIYAGIFDFNTTSQKVLSKAGFYKEAVLKNALIKNGKVCDEERYAILKDGF